MNQATPQEADSQPTTTPEQARLLRFSRTAGRVNLLFLLVLAWYAPRMREIFISMNYEVSYLTQLALAVPRIGWLAIGAVVLIFAILKDRYVSADRAMRINVGLMGLAACLAILAYVGVFHPLLKMVSNIHG